MKFLYLSLVVVGVLSVEVAEGKTIVIIDFDDVDDSLINTDVGKTYESLGAVFSNAAFHRPTGFGLTMDLVASGPNRITALNQSFPPALSFAPDNPIVVEFLRPVRSASMTAHGFGRAGIQLDAYSQDGMLLGSDQRIGIGFGINPDFTNSTAKLEVVVPEFLIHSISLYQPIQNFDSGGGFDGTWLDNLAFEPVPEPAALLALAPAILLLFLRRRRAAAIA